MLQLQSKIHDIDKINAILRKSRSLKALIFFFYKYVLETNLSKDYLKYWKLSRNLETLAMNLYTYQHIIKEVFVESTIQNSTVISASKIKTELNTA